MSYKGTSFFNTINRYIIYFMVENRTFGSETEFGIECQLDEKVRESDKTAEIYVVDAEDYDDKFRLMNARLKIGLEDYVREQGGFQEFMLNGARAYVDLGAHPEYSTPECQSAADLVAREIAGERIMFEAMQWMVNKGYIDSFKLRKDVANGHGFFWGYHENFQIEKMEQEEISSKLAPLLAPHLVSRLIWAGAGLYTPEGQHVGQKAGSITTLADGLAYSNDRRPIIDASRSQEALMDRNRWRRLHITSTDANVLPWPIFMRFGTTSLVLRMIESGVDLSDLRLMNEVVSFHQVAEDTTLKKEIKTRSGEYMTALDIQESLLERSARFLDENGSTEEEAVVLSEWAKIIADLRLDPDLADGRIEWITKQNSIREIEERTGRTYTHTKARAFELMWSDLDPETGIGIRYRQLGQFALMPEENKIETAMKYPPGNRARLRTKLIPWLRAMKEKCDETEGVGSKYELGWSKLAGNGLYIHAKDPLSEKAVVDMRDDKFFDELASESNPEYCSYPELD